MEERQKLKCVIQQIEKNIAEYQEEKESIDADTKHLYDAYMEGDTEVYSQLMVSLNLQEHITETLNRNRNARLKPYFGRVDYLDKEENKTYCLYIGKHGINKNKTEILIVDWRAAAAGIYYECAMGDGEYHAPSGEAIPIHLDLKRTFDIENQELLGFFDSDAVANDDLLVKYLSKNKDVVLGEIVATIQQEQNAIIREKPGRNIIVQGVAGSGKTTVAIHRISYLLYNFSDRYTPEEFCIIGSNKLLLNYITSGLPDLDVHNTQQYRMDEFLLRMLDDKIPWKRYRPVTEESIFLPMKSSMAFVQKLEDFMEEKIASMIPMNDVTASWGGSEKAQILFSRSSIEQCLHLYRDHSAYQKIEALSQRLAARIRLVTDGEEAAVKKTVMKMFRPYFKNCFKKQSIGSIYAEFLMWLFENDQEDWIPRASQEEKENWVASVQKYRLDQYDLAALALIHHRYSRTEEETRWKQIIIDEAQDFGVMIFYVLHTVLPGMTFTIMGDVSQNIHYDTGMNDWEELRKQVFSDPKDCFHMLRKSYRNTIEISHFASHILEQATFKTYGIEPIVRHGAPVEKELCESEEEMLRAAVRFLKEGKKKGYDTNAVICRTSGEAEYVRKLLKNQKEIHGIGEEEETFQKGIQVLPIYLTKGLEFDTVLLWNPNCQHYEKKDGDAKLLYVAVTRALHELRIVYTGTLCELLQDSTS